MMQPINEWELLGKLAEKAQNGNDFADKLLDDELEKIFSYAELGNAIPEKVLQAQRLYEAVLDFSEIYPTLDQTIDKENVHVKYVNSFDSINIILLMPEVTLLPELKEKFIKLYDLADSITFADSNESDQINVTLSVFGVWEVR